jgi:hypothetical protein
VFFKKTMKKVLAERGYKHCTGDDELSLHGEYARNIQYAFSKEHSGFGEKVVDIIYLSADMHRELIVIGFFRENTAIENGILVNQDVTIPLEKFSIEEFEKQLDRVIPKEAPIRKHTESGGIF